MHTLKMDKLENSRMQQLSLLSANTVILAGLMPAIRASMRRAAGDPEGEGRKLLVDKMNLIARNSGIRLTSGNKPSISKDMLDKWLSPSDSSHQPGLHAILVFCLAAGDMEPIRVILQTLGLDIMTEADRHLRDLGQTELDLQAARIRKRQLKERL